MTKYITTCIGISRADMPSFKRNKGLERKLKEIGLTYSETLDWGTEVMYLHVEASNPKQAYNKIRCNKRLLERAYAINIDLEKIYLAPEMILQSYQITIFKNQFFLTNSGGKNGTRILC